MPILKKIFGIGLSKTVTTSLAKALEILGYKTIDYPGAVKYVPGDLTPIDSNIFTDYQAFTDTPIPSFFRELDDAFVNSKFILTVREIDSWLKSCKKQFTKRHGRKIRQAEKKILVELYGCESFKEKQFRNGYERFVNDVLVYFEQRPTDFLVLDVCGGEGSEKLCPYLNEAVPNIAFPTTNVTAIEWLNINGVISAAIAGGAQTAKYYARQLSPPLAKAEGIQPINSAKRYKQTAEWVRTKLDALRYRNETSRFEAAQLASHRAIVYLLQRLNGSVPIISARDTLTFHGKRFCWTHY